MKEGAPVYQRKEKATADEKDSYFIVSHKNKYQYAQNMFFLVCMTQHMHRLTRTGWVA